MVVVNCGVAEVKLAAVKIAVPASNGNHTSQSQRRIIPHLKTVLKDGCQMSQRCAPLDAAVIVAASVVANAVVSLIAVAIEAATVALVVLTV